MPQAAANPEHSDDNRRRDDWADEKVSSADLEISVFAVTKVSIADDTGQSRNDAHDCARHEYERS